MLQLLYQTSNDHKWQSTAPHQHPKPTLSLEEMNEFCRTMGDNVHPKLQSKLPTLELWWWWTIWLLCWPRLVLHTPGWLNQCLVQRRLAQRFDALAAQNNFQILFSSGDVIRFYWKQNYSTSKMRAETPETKKVMWRPRARKSPTFNMEMLNGECA